MRKIATVVLTSLALIATAEAAPSGSWRGKATNMARDFNYGKVTFRTSGKRMTNLKIEAVTVSGCGGFTTLVIPRLTIKGRRFTGAYQPVKGVDQIVSANGTFSGSIAKGTFSAGPLCRGAGRFTARLR